MLGRVIMGDRTPELSGERGYVVGSGRRDDLVYVVYGPRSQIGPMGKFCFMFLLTNTSRCGHSGSCYDRCCLHLLPFGGRQFQPVWNRLAIVSYLTTLVHNSRGHTWVVG